MKHALTILSLCLCLAEGTFCQAIVVDAASLENIRGYSFIPDVNGKVLVEMSIFDHLTSKVMTDSVTTFPNWPVVKPGENERGGVYGNLDYDPELEVVYSIGNFIYAFNINGTPVNGWPRALDYPADGAPAFGDIDGDGFGEIVVTTHQTATFASGKVYAFEINGADVMGFPVSTQGGPLRTPVLADLDGDGADEIIIAVRKWPEGFIHVYRGDGTMFPNFPVRMDYAPGAAVAVGDITGDDIPEIVAESYYSLHAFNLDGVILPGFPYTPGDNRVFSYSSPVLADIDGDGQREIICGDHSTSVGNGAVHIVKNDGTSYPGWPKFTDYWIYGPPSVGDINDDDILDILVGDQVLSPVPVDKVYGWTSTTGNVLPGFPIDSQNGINSQILLADLDEDGQVELVFDDNTASNSMGRYPGYNHDGTPMEGWPIHTFGSTFFINPFVADINHDGIIDLSGGGTDQASGNTSIYLWNSNKAYNHDLAILPILQYNNRHTGVYGDYLQVGMRETRALQDHVLNIYPNPCFDQLTIDSRQLTGNVAAGVLSNNKISHLTISDFSGREIIHLPGIGSFPVTLDISSLVPGLYILTVNYENSRTISKKFVKLSE